MNEPDLEELKRVQDRHNRIIFGDPESDPPRPGIHQVLAGIWDLLKDEEKGNLALHKRVNTIESEDRRRTAFVGGAKWVFLVLGGLGGFVIHLIWGK